MGGGSVAAKIGSDAYKSLQCFPIKEFIHGNILSLFFDFLSNLSQLGVKNTSEIGSNHMQQCCLDIINLESSRQNPKYILHREN